MNYEERTNFYNGFAIVGNKGKHGFINEKEEVIGKGLIYDTVDFFNNGFARVVIKNKMREFWGFIDTNGNVLGNGIIYTWCFNFNNAGIALITKNVTEQGFIDKTGKEYMTEYPIIHFEPYDNDFYYWARINHKKTKLDVMNIINQQRLKEFME